MEDVAVNACRSIHEALAPGRASAQPSAIASLPVSALRLINLAGFEAFASEHAYDAGRIVSVPGDVCFPRAQHRGAHGCAPDRLCSEPFTVIAGC